MSRKERLFADFTLAMQKAKAWEADQFKGIAGSEDWTAHAWLLERRFPDQYGRPGRRFSRRGARDDLGLYLRSEP